MSVELWLVVALVVAFAATMQGVVGVGLGMISAPILAIIDPAFIPGPFMVAAILMTVLMFLREREHAEPRSIGWAFVGRVPGSLLGFLALTTWTTRTLSLVLGSVVLAGVMISVTNLRFQVTSPSLVLAGTAAGFMGTSTGVGGPPMALLLQRGAPEVVRATLAGFFLAGLMLSITLLLVSGEMGSEGLLLGLRLCPSVLVGFLVSSRLRGVVDGGRLRPALLAISAGSALTLLARNL